MKNFITYLSLVVGLLLCFSCKKDKTNPNPDNKLYLAGYCYNQANVSVAAYWNKGQLKTVTDQTKESYARDIVVKDGVVYMAGVFDGKPCYWKDGEKIDLSENNTVLGEVRAIAFYNGTIYLGGNVQLAGVGTYKARFWEVAVDGTVKVAFTSANTGSVNDLVMDTNGDVYGVGNDAGKAVYWKKYALYPLGTGSGDATAICIKNNHRYISGTETSPWGTYLGYWEDAIFKPYADKSSAGSVSGIYIDNLGMPIVVGKKYFSAQPKASYWDAAGADHQLSNDFSEATSVIYTGVDTYIGGKVGTIACYWKNGVLVSMNTADSYVNGISMAE